MNTLKIGVVEDELIIADNLCSTLRKLGYTPTKPVSTYQTALDMIHQEVPDLVLLDIQIKGSRDGIEVAHYIRTNLHLPFIFLTANNDPATVERAKQTFPNAYLSKPFSKNDLFTAIEVCVHNFLEKEQTRPERLRKNYLVNDSIFVKEGSNFHKLKFDDILFLESENVYVHIHTVQKKLLVRTTMQQYLEHFDERIFVRIHRSYVVNVNHIESINSENIMINRITLPLSKNYRDELITRLRLG